MQLPPDALKTFGWKSVILKHRTVCIKTNHLTNVTYASVLFYVGQLLILEDGGRG